MSKRGPLHTIEVQKHLNRVQAGTNEPTGIRWFVDVRFSDAHWYQERRLLRDLLDHFAATKWFGAFDVFAAGHKVGAAFETVAQVRDLVVSGAPSIAIFASGEPRHTVDIEDSEATLAIDVDDFHLDLRLWFGARSVEEYRNALLDDVINGIVALRNAVPHACVANAVAAPNPLESVRYRRVRPLRLANRALDAVVDILDRDAPAEGPPWAFETTAMINAAVPANARREERDRLVIVRWVDDPSDPRALAEACAAHERWLVPLVPTRIAPGWNEAGDLEVLDNPQIVDASTTEWAVQRRDGSTALVAASRSDALALKGQASQAGFGRVLYRDPEGILWDPDPAGDWVSLPA